MLFLPARASGWKKVNSVPGEAAKHVLMASNYIRVDMLSIRSTGPNVCAGCGAVDLEALVLLATGALQCSVLAEPFCTTQALFPAPLSSCSCSLLFGLALPCSATSLHSFQTGVFAGPSEL